MSDHEPEPIEPETEPVEPTEPTEPTEEEEEEEHEATEPAEPAEAPEPEAPEGMTEKQLEASRKKLDNENERHRNRIADIIGEEQLLLEPCPLCNGFADGYRFPVVPPPEIVDAVRVAIGLPDVSNYQQAKHAHECPDCVGLGLVLSGSKLAENVVITCPLCNGSGYNIVSTATGEITAPTLGNGHVAPELPAGVNPDDPAVRELRARGFTVFPPVQIPTGIPS